MPYHCVLWLWVDSRQTHIQVGFVRALWLCTLWQEQDQWVYRNPEMLWWQSVGNHLVPGTPLDSGLEWEEVWGYDESKWLEETDIHLERLWHQLERGLMHL